MDRSRSDRSFSSGHRELMVQIWYPATSTGGFRPASYMPRCTAAFVEHQDGLPPGTIARILVHASQGAPAAPGRRAVLVYSPGSGDMRSASTTLVENLASEGFVVIAIDHTRAYSASNSSSDIRSMISITFSRVVMG